MNLKNLSSEELYRMRMDLINELGNIEEVLEEKRKRNKYVFKAEELSWRPASEATGKSVGNVKFKQALMISPEFGFNIHNFKVFQIEIQPHSSEGSYHRHGEAVKYYLSGRGKEIIGDGVYDVKAGDACFIPANIFHGTQNPYDEPLRFVAVAQHPVGVAYVQVAAPFMSKS